MLVVGLIVRAMLVVLIIAATGVVIVLRVP